MAGCLRLALPVVAAALLLPGTGEWLRAAAPSDRRVSFAAADGVQLVASWYEPPNRPAPAVILVHMFDRSRRDWEILAARLASSGIGALAIDLRGHGDSPRAPRPSSPAELSALAADIAAARRYLATRGDVHPGRIGIAGASLGASLAVLAAAETSSAGVALLSPSLDYRGVRIEAAARKVASPMLLVASAEDGYASRTVRDLRKAGGGPREIVTLQDAGHGTMMLDRDPALAWTLVDWFRRTL